MSFFVVIIFIADFLLKCIMFVVVCIFVQECVFQCGIDGGNYFELLLIEM